MTNFDFAFKKLLEVEGTAFTKASHDHGGPTKCGITEAIFQEYKETDPNIEAQSVMDMTEEDAKNIYRALFWDTFSLDKLTSFRVSYALFDQHVNRGYHAVAQQTQYILQSLGHHVVADGVFGPMTTNALNVVAPNEFLSKFVDACQDSYIRIAVFAPDQLKFLQGWINRTRLIRDMSSNPPEDCL